MSSGNREKLDGRRSKHEEKNPAVARLPIAIGADVNRTDQVGPPVSLLDNTCGSGERLSYQLRGQKGA